MNDLFFIGDSHSECQPILDWSNNFSDSILYHVGDVGIDEFRLEWLANKLSKRNNKFYAIFGNHEYFRFNNQVYGKDKNVKLLSDYSILEVNGKKILGIGGAISLDRQYRKDWIKKHPGQINYYQENEQFILDELILKNLKDIDIFVTHTISEKYIPYKIPGFVEKFAQHDSDLIKDIEKERRDWDKAFDILSNNNKLEYVIHGHWHQHYRSNINETKLIGLDINEIWKYE